MTQPVLVTLSSGAFYPFQYSAIGLSTDGYLGEKVRLSLLVTGGFTWDRHNELRWSGYGDASLGVVVLRAARETTVELPIIAARFRHEDSEAAPRLRAVVPSSHSLELEAGVFTGRYPLYRCADCTDTTPGVYEDASQYIVVPYVGVRYVYYRLAWSEQAPFRSTSRFHLGLDLLTHPFKPVDPSLFNDYDSHPSHTPVGARIVTHLPAFTCALVGFCLGLGASVGYLPAPSDVVASVNLELF